MEDMVSAIFSVVSLCKAIFLRYPAVFGLVMGVRVVIAETGLGPILKVLV